MKPAATREFSGVCHCGAIGFEFQLGKPGAAWNVRRCDCSFCTAHGAVYTSDPSGELRFRCTDSSQVGRYRFGFRTADFIHCRTCGVFLGAIMESEGREYAVVNVNVLTNAPDDLPAPEIVSFEAESGQERRRRREQRWTPVLQSL